MARPEQIRAVRQAAGKKTREDMVTTAASSWGEGEADKLRITSQGAL